MARFIQDVVSNKPDDFVYFMMNDYLQKNGFVTSDWKGEPAYRAGDGFMEGYKYLKWSYTSGVFHLEAWMKGTFGGEMNLDGFVGCLMKKPYKENLLRLITLLQQTIPESGQAMGAAQTASTGGGQAAGTASATGNSTAGTPNPGPIPVQTMDNYKDAQMALVFGILSLVLCWSPIFCILMSVFAFSKSRTGKGSSKANLAKAGKICSIVALCLTAGLFFINIVLNGLLIFLQ